MVCSLLTRTQGSLAFPNAGETVLTIYVCTTFFLNLKTTLEAQKSQSLVIGKTITFILLERSCQTVASTFCKIKFHVFYQKPLLSKSTLGQGNGK